MVTIRAWQDLDAKTLYTLCKDKQLRNNWVSTYLYPYTMRKAKACINFYKNANSIRFLIRAIVQDNNVCGFIQCEVKGYDCAEISYWLHSDYQKLGIMKEAVSLQCKEAFLTLPIKTIYARVVMSNYSSRKVLLRNNFIESKETAPIYMYFLHKA